ncbi:MAG: thioredoxin family protein [Patescibacteria group bacterium]
MQKKILVILAGVGILAVVVIVLVMNNQDTTTNTATVNTGNANTAVLNTSSTNSTEPTSTNVNNSVKANVSVSNTNSANTNATIATAQFVDYTSSALVTAQQRGRAVLYFHANWCPVCRVLEPDLRANISTFPSDVTILKVDYDHETALKQQYGVTYQHTFVQVDANGVERKQWSGGDSKASSVRDNIL